MKKLFIFCTAITISLQCLGWGQKGHDTTCAIAQKHLTNKTLQHITQILDGKSIVYYANWLDNASNTPEYAYSKTWHYKNIDEGQTWENAPILETGNIELALNEQIAKLTKGNLSKEDEQLALKMVIHLMGDLHQPMHCGHKSDRGGNSHQVTFFNAHTNLHSIWDTNLVESAHKWSHNEWVEELDRLTDEEIAKVEQGTIADWGNETFELCKEVYADSPSDKNLSYDYVAKWTPVIEQQLLHGGIRLAMVLNKIYDPQAKK